jgi:hypothetical protein
VWDSTLTLQLTTKIKGQSQDCPFSLQHYTFWQCCWIQLMTYDQKGVFCDIFQRFNTSLQPSLLAAFQFPGRNINTQEKNERKINYQTPSFSDNYCLYYSNHSARDVANPVRAGCHVRFFAPGIYSNSTLLNAGNADVSDNSGVATLSGVTLTTRLAGTTLNVGSYNVEAAFSGDSTGAISKWTSSFDLSHGWTVSDYVRTVGDVDGDGLVDLIGFALDGVYIAK